MNPASPSFGTEKGSCGYGLIPKDKYPFFSTAAFAPSNKFFKADELNACGQCFQIQCADTRGGICKTDAAGKPLSVMVMISDSCPECGADHIDVQSLTFAKLADPGIGRIAIQYRRIECTPPDDMKVSVMDYRGANGWIRLSIDDTGGRAAVRSVAVRGGSGDWKPLANSWGATWEMGSAPAPPLSFKIVGDDGSQVEAANVVTQAGGSGRVFSTGVQWDITDPAAKLVQAFNGCEDPMLITSATPGNTDSPGAAAVASASASAGGGSSSASTNASSTASANGGASSASASASASSSSGGKASASASASASGKVSAASAPPPPAPTATAQGASCTDVPSPDGYTCAQQKGWGKCSQSWFAGAGYCRATCGACGSGSAAKPAPATSSAKGQARASTSRKLLLSRA